MAPIRVLRVIPDLQVGGVQRMMLRSLGELRRRGVESAVCCIGGRGEFASRFESEGFPVEVIHFRSRLDPSGLWGLRKFAAQGCFDIVHAHMYAANMAANFGLMAQRAIKVVNSYHSQSPTEDSGQARRVRWTRRIPAAFIAVSEAVREPLLEMGIPASRIRVIHNAIELPAAPEPLRRHKPTDPLQLLWVGRFVKQKRHHLMIEIMKGCRRKNVPVHLTLVGDGPTRGRTERAVREAEIEHMVRFAGVSNDVPEHLRRAELFMSVSEREGFSNAMLEACAAGRGFLASDIAPHRELKGIGSSGLIIPDSVEDWVTLIAKLAADRDQVAAMGTAAFSRAHDFSIEQNGRKTAALYEDILGRSVSEAAEEPPSTDCGDAAEGIPDTSSTKDTKEHEEDDDGEAEGATEERNPETAQAAAPDLQRES